MAIIEMDIHKIYYLDRLRPTGPLTKSFMESLDLGKTAGNNYNLLLVVSGQ